MPNKSSKVVKAKARLEGLALAEAEALIRAEKRNQLSIKVRVDRTRQPVAYDRAEAKRLAREESQMWGWYD
jgi:hypothetical protein